MNIKALRQRVADLKGQISKASKERAAIGDKAVAENRALTAEEREKFVAAGQQVVALETQLSETEEMLTAAERALELERGASAVADPEARPNIQVGQSADDKLAASPSFFGAALHAVRKLAMRDATDEDHKLVKLMGRSFDKTGQLMAAPTGASSDVPSDGGFLIAPDRSNTILQRTYDVGQISSLVTRQPLSGNSLTLPAVDETSRADGSRFGGISSTWVGQGTTATAGKPKFRLMELKLKKLLAFVYGTDELIADAVAFSAWVNRNLPLELMFRVEDAIINGDGSNKPIGILNAGAAVTITRNTSARILYEDVSAMWARMWAPLRRTAVWCIDQSCEQQLEQLSIAIGTAGVLAPIYKPAGTAVGPDGTQGYSPATLYGRPILTTEYAAALGTVGDIVLANFGEYTVIDKGGVDQAVSLHVAFLTDEAVWRFTYRADGQLNWNAALTPKNGGNTLAPVVTLT